MNDLDEKLKEILRDGALGHYTTNGEGDFVPLDWSGTPDKYFADYVAQIKQAFADAGYATKEQWHGIVNSHIAITNRLMSGQEWYDRFAFIVKTEEQLYKEAEDTYLDMAKRAAGLE